MLSRIFVYKNVILMPYWCVKRARKHKLRGQEQYITWHPEDGISKVWFFTSLDCSHVGIVCWNEICKSRWS